MVVNAVYLAVASAVSALLADAGVDAHNIDEIVYVGGTTCLPGLDVCICLSGGFREEIETPFSRGTEEALVIQQRFWLVDVLSTRQTPTLPRGKGQEGPQTSTGESMLRAENSDKLRT